MNTFRLIYHQIKADLLGYLRGYTFLVALGLSIAVTYLLVPAEDASYVSVNFGGYRPLYSSAGIGGMVTILSAIFIIWFAFFIVRGAINRDRQTGVGQIIATTPIKRWQYLLGKWMSNATIMFVVVVGIIIASGIMQLIRGEVTQIDLLQLASPLFLILLPVLWVVSAISILFESIPELRGVLGVAVYFILFVNILSDDSLGSVVIVDSIRNDLQETVSAYNGTVSCCIQFKDSESPATIYPLERLETFEWDGMRWTLDLLLNRLSLLALSIGLLIPATVLFDRFSDSRIAFGWLDRLTGGQRLKIQNGLTQLMRMVRRTTLMRWLFPLDDVIVHSQEMLTETNAQVHLTPLVSNTIRFRPLRILMTEIRLLLKGRSGGWYLVAIGLFVASVASPYDVVRNWLLPLSLLWPLMIWSSMGVREQRYHTQQVVFSTPSPLRTQLPFTWLAGVLVTLLLVGGGLIRLSLAGSWESVLLTLIAVLFIPTLALTLGIWSGGNKAFEGIYLILWYVNMNGVRAFDFMGLASETTIQSGTPIVFLMTTIILIVLSVVRRKQQLQL